MSQAVNTIYKLLDQWLIGGTMVSQVLIWLQQLNRTQLYSLTYTWSLYRYLTVTAFEQLTSRRAVVSREAKKKQHAYASSGQCDHYSELFARMDGLKF